MILVCEISFDDGAHVPFNAGLLATIRAAFPKEELSFFGAAAYMEELKKQAGQSLAGSIAWKEILSPTTGHALQGALLPRVERHSATVEKSSSRLNFTPGLDFRISLDCAGVESCAMCQIQAHSRADRPPRTEWCDR